MQDRIKIVAVEPDKAPTLTRALEAGRPVDAEAGGVAAESLAPRRVGELVFPIIRRYIDKTVLVSDEAILDAQRRLWTTLRVVAEPGRRRGARGTNLAPVCADRLGNASVC